MTIKSIWVESVLIVIFYACMYSNPHKETKVRKYNQSCTFTELKRPWCLGSHFSNFIFPFLLILFAMSYYVREIVNSLYYSILKKSSFFFFYMTTRDFNLCISLINLASNIQILNNCIQHVGTNRPNGTVDTFQIYTEVFLAIRNLTLKLTRPVS